VRSKRIASILVRKTTLTLDDGSEIVLEKRSVETEKLSVMGTMEKLMMVTKVS